MKRLAVSIAFAATLVVPGAHATELTLHGEAQPLNRRHQLRLDVGFASALGFGGVAYSYLASEHFQLEAGVGAGLTGVQLSLMPKLTAGSQRHKFVLGAGVSLGVGTQSLIRSDSAVVPFANVDVGYQYVSRGGFTFNIAVGPTIVLGGRMSSGFFDGPLRDATGAAFIQCRIGFGYTF